MSARNVFGDGKRVTFWRLAWRRLLLAFSYPPRVTITRTSTRPLTDADWKHFDAAFAKMDEAFAELRKIK